MRSPSTRSGNPATGVAAWSVLPSADRVRSQGLSDRALTIRASICRPSWRTIVQRPLLGKRLPSLGRLLGRHGRDDAAQAARRCPRRHGRGHVDLPFLRQDRNVLRKSRRRQAERAYKPNDDLHVSLPVWPRTGFHNAAGDGHGRLPTKSAKVTDFSANSVPQPPRPTSAEPPPFGLKWPFMAVRFVALIPCRRCRPPRERRARREPRPNDRSFAVGRRSRPVRGAALSAPRPARRSAAADHRHAEPHPRGQSLPLLRPAQLRPALPRPGRGRRHGRCLHHAGPAAGRPALPGRGRLSRPVDRLAGGSARRAPRRAACAISIS